MRRFSQRVYFKIFFENFFISLFLKRIFRTPPVQLNDSISNQNKARNKPIYTLCCTSAYLSSLEMKHQNTQQKQDWIVIVLKVYIAKKHLNVDEIYIFVLWVNNKRNPRVQWLCFSIKRDNLQKFRAHNTAVVIFFSLLFWKL